MLVIVAMLLPLFCRRRRFLFLQCRHELTDFCIDIGIMGEGLGDLGAKHLPVLFAEPVEREERVFPENASKN